MADTMLDWSRSWSAHWRIHRVDRATWADGARLDGVTELSVQRDSTGDAPLIETATMTIVGDEPPTDYYRLVLIAEQDGTWERQDVATLLYERTSGTADHGVRTLTLAGRSVLWPASVRIMPITAYAPAGADGARYVGNLLRSCVHAPVEVAGSFTLASNVVHEPGTTVLQAAWDVLRAGNHTMIVDGSGRVSIVPVASSPSLMLDAAGAALVRPGIKYTLDYSDVPNRYIAVDDFGSAVAVNDSPSSPTSTVARGCYVDEYDDSPVRVGGETLGAYARRRLHELSIVQSDRTYTRKWVPGVYPGSVVRGSMASVALDGDMRVITQRLKCGAGIEVSERAAQEVSTWT